VYLSTLPLAKINGSAGIRFKGSLDEKKNKIYVRRATGALRPNLLSM